MTLRDPRQVGSHPHEAPSVVWEVLIEVAFSPALKARQIGKLQDALWNRIEAVIAETLGPHLREPNTPTVYGVRGRREATPLFPMVAGGSRFTCNLDVVELVERADLPADLRQLAYDARGRAYELDVEIVYHRRPQHDGARRAKMPTPDEVARNDERRDTQLQHALRNWPRGE